MNRVPCSERRGKGCEAFALLNGEYGDLNPRIFGSRKIRTISDTMLFTEKMIVLGDGSGIVLHD